MGFSDKDKILIKNLHDSAWNSLWDFFNDTSSTACELTVLILSISVTFIVTRDLSRPPRGGYNPLVFMQHPLTCLQQRGVIRGCKPRPNY